MVVVVFRIFRRFRRFLNLDISCSYTYNLKNNFIYRRRNMNKILVFFLLAIIFYQKVQSQNTHPIGLGLVTSAKANLNLNVPESNQTVLTFNLIPDFGATLYVPISQTLASTFDVGYSSYYICNKRNNGANDDNTFMSRYSYFSIAPSINYGYLLLGLNIGIPLSWSFHNTSNTISFSSSQGEDMVTNVEIRIGGTIPVIQDDFGRLNMIVSAGYMLRKIDENPPSGASNNFSPQIASILIGVSYLFNL